MEKLKKPTLIKTCAICGEPSFLRNFGAISCNACAAFFRRSIVLKKTYFCKNKKTCFKFDGKMKRLNCRFCRFTKCFEAGMKAENVRMSSLSSNSSLLENGDDILNKLVYFRRAAYFNRMQAKMRIMENIDKPGKATWEQMGKICEAEGLVLHLYLESTGLLNLVEPDDEFSYLVEVMPLWVEFDIGLATIRNDGIAKNLIYFIDESYRELNEDQLMHFYQACSSAKNIDAVARVECDFYKDFFRIFRKIYQYRFDEIELALLIHLLLLQIACEFPQNYNRKNMTEAMKKEIFIALKKHYERDGIDYSLRLGDLIFVFTELQNIRKLADELRLIMQLNGIFASDESKNTDIDIKIESSDLF